MTKIDNTAPFFILGSPRSGTTLLRNILTSHSDIAVLPETFFFSQTLPRAKPYLKGDVIIDLDSFLNLIKKNKYMELLHPYIDKSLFNENKQWTIEGLLSFIGDKFARSQGKVRWGDKTPSHLWYWRQISRIYPHSKFILIVRDGRDVVNSISKLPFTSGNLLVDSFRWKVDIKIGLRAYRALGCKRAMVVSYEDLVSDKDTVKKICDFLSLSYEKNMLENFDKTDFLIHKHTVKMFTDKMKTEIFTTSIGRYKNELSSKEIKKLNTLLNKELIHYGYHSEYDLQYSIIIKWGIYICSLLRFTIFVGNKFLLRKLNLVRQDKKWDFYH
jgi:hypothetical protein